MPEKTTQSVSSTGVWGEDWKEVELNEASHPASAFLLLNLGVKTGIEIDYKDNMILDLFKKITS